jgi:hypothetical protein
MSQTLAIAEAKDLQAAVRDYGAKCTIELKAGRPWTGSAWYSKKRVLMNHHTAGPSSGLTPSYAVCRNGRPGVPGPLCNGYGGRDLVFRIVTMGLANHPGAGGPLTVGGVYLPKDSARISSFGIEWEHNGTSPWSDAMLEFMGRVGAAVLDWGDMPLVVSIEHKTWAPERKIDRNAFSQSGSTGQSLIKRYQGGSNPPGGDDFMGFINNQAEFNAAMNAWAKSDSGKQYLANANAFAWRGPTIKDAFPDLFALAIKQIVVRRTIEGKSAEVPLLQDWADTNTISRRVEVALAALTKLVGDGADITEETIRQAVDEAFDARIEDVQVDLVVAKPEPESGETGIPTVDQDSRRA